MTSIERVVLLDEDGRPTGAALKSEVHHHETPLHLAFSCHVRDDDGNLLLTRRALTKRTWPGVWTNAFCGHPEPFEPIPDAVARRADHELGLRITDLELALADFRYRAVDASGTVENEICPVYTARALTTPSPHPDEVMEYRWVAPDHLDQALAAVPWMFSPWLVLQREQLTASVSGASDAMAHA